MATTFKAEDVSCGPADAALCLTQSGIEKGNREATMLGRPTTIRAKI
jgi:hypothetical protein